METTDKRHRVECPNRRGKKLISTEARIVEIMVTPPQNGQPLCTTAECGCVRDFKELSCDSAPTSISGPIILKNSFDKLNFEEIKTDRFFDLLIKVNQNSKNLGR